MSCKELRRYLAYAILLLTPVSLFGCDDDGAADPIPDAQIDAAGGDAAPVTDAGPIVDMAPPEPDAGPPEPEVTPIDSARRADAERLLDGPVPMAVPVAEGLVVAQGADGIAVVSPEGTTWLGAEPTMLTAAVQVDGDLLVAGDTGLYGRIDDSLLLSPLDTLVDGVTTLTRTTDGALWIIDAAGLHVYRDGRLSGVDPGPMAPTAATAVGAWSGTPALWVVGDEALYAVGFGDDGLQAWALDAEAPVSAVAVNSDGGLWIAADGKLFHLAADGTWTDWIVPFTVVDIAAHPMAPDVWIDVGGGLWQLREGRARPVSDTPDFTHIEAEADGSVLLFGEGPLSRVRPGRFLRLSGIDEGAIVDREVVVELEPTSPELVTEVRWSLDGAEDAVLAGPPWQIMLAPGPIDEGEHALRATADYETGEQVEIVLNFRVQGPPTWDGDVEAIFFEHCDACHGERGYAHRMEEMATWIEEIDDIIDAIENDRMPLPPNPLVPSDELELIRAWADTGFLRSWP